MAARKHAALTQARIRAAVSNGSSLIEGVDARSAWMRRFRDLIQDYAKDLGGDITEAEKRLVRRAAMLTLQAEMLDAKFAEHETLARREDLEIYQRVSNSLRRLLETLGLQRRARDITPDPLQYAARSHEVHP
jgi:hypothetical protein